ncbi:hypothetical protein Peur_033900 [Populus x canadensis]
MEVVSVQMQVLDEVEIREFVIDHVGHRCCWGSCLARTWKIHAIEDAALTHFTCCHLTTAYVKECDGVPLGGLDILKEGAHRAKSVQQAELHQLQMSFFIEPKESSCATQACQRSLAFFPDSFFLNKFSSQVIAERASFCTSHCKGHRGRSPVKILLCLEWLKL